MTPDPQSAVWGFAGAVVGMLGMWLVAKLRRRSDREANDVSSLSAAAREWRTMNDARKRETDDLRAQIAELREEVKATRVAHEIEISQMSRQHDAWQTTATNYIESLREHIIRKLPPPPPALPADWPSREA